MRWSGFTHHDLEAVEWVYSSWSRCGGVGLLTIIRMRLSVFTHHNLDEVEHVRLALPLDGREFDVVPVEGCTYHEGRRRGEDVGGHAIHVPSTHVAGHGQQVRAVGGEEIEWTWRGAWSAMDMMPLVVHEILDFHACRIVYALIMHTFLKKSEWKYLYPSIKIYEFVVCNWYRIL